MIITHYLGSTYATKAPISLSASIAFEQLYEMVEGDSATCAEFYALLSSIAGVPLKQSIAVTGSMDQNGEVQPVGAINEKIEGFFDICSLVDSKKSHGIMISLSNVKHLMLKDEVLEAVKNKTFKIYAIESVNEGLEILTGKVSGTKDANGHFPKESINYLVEEKLKLFANKSKQKKI